ncbi:hypothetical protein K9U39_11060 [Rhodoblastus acidophilus]|uniref:Uncharacterized protein n=1 Tax=Candidatus Rhodoblastus alkanivorans TaxID=2954117 RepID=A0ABS9Z9X0_9HYPH|nr:hypothetical protein [Candidatus Rhodoblastus alkanivorans]MCI4678926.1 hypothetical protein [Candidatus Rhodoblastus alkanivorans]MCI4684150.1 hypothetical protein [Candidatus Rhodoblastus alkanivorans]MDI4641471.1 hypothetical protein [Rhodoblastus acidophilus]
MSKTHKNKISLPKLGCLETPSRESARRALKKFQRAGDRAPEGPSVERLIQAGGAARIETFSEMVEVSRGDKFETETVDSVRMRLDDGPLARLRDRNQLDRADKARNFVLAQAGEKYRESFFRAGLDPLRSLDPSQEVKAAFSPNGMWRCESQIENLQKFRAAREAIPEDFRDPLAAIVLEDREIVDVGREIGAYKDAKMAGAVALFTLRRGLTALARHYRLISAAGAG